MPKPILFIDTNLINDAYGRGVPDKATGELFLNALKEKYDLHIISTIQKELIGNPLYPTTLYDTKTSTTFYLHEWVTNNISTENIHNTAIFDDAGKGGSTITDPALYTNNYSADVDYKLTNVKIASHY